MKGKYRERHSQNCNVRKHLTPLERKRKEKKTVFLSSFFSSRFARKRAKQRIPMPPTEPAAAAQQPARTVTPISCGYEELLRREPHVLAAVEKVGC
jgi:hypothetical protein